MHSNERITLADLRRRAGLTQRQVADVFNTRSETISAWERRATYPQLTFAEILQLTVLYKCTLEDLSIALDNTTRDQAESFVRQKLQSLE